MEYIYVFPFLLIDALVIVINFIGLIVYFLFKKKGKQVKLKVLSCQQNPKGLYDIEFEFEYNNKIVTESIMSKKQFKINEEYSALYLEKLKFNKFMIDGGGGFEANVPGFFITLIFSVIIFILCLIILTHPENINIIIN